MSTTTQHHRIVVAGGGSGGLSIAARLATQGLEVALIEPSSRHVYQPFWTLVGAGIVDHELSVRPMADVIPSGVKWLKTSVTRFQPELNQLQTEDGQTLSYDFLVVALGLQIDWHKIPGLPERLGQQGVCSIYDYDGSAQTWELIRNFKGGHAVFTFPPPPIKCAGAPQKILYLAEEYFRKANVRDKTRVSYFCATPTIFSVKKYADALMRQCVEPRGIEAHFNWQLKSVDTDNRQALFENSENGEEQRVDYDLLHVVPPMSAPDVIKNSALANAEGWVDVDKATLRHKRFDNVFAIGDCAGLPTSKTAAAIRAQAPVLAANLLAAVNGQTPAATYDGYTACPLVTGYGKAILAEFDYELQPQETFPFDQSKESLLLYLVKRFVLPQLYWRALVKGRKWPWSKVGT